MNLELNLSKNINSSFQAEECSLHISNFSYNFPGGASAVFFFLLPTNSMEAGDAAKPWATDML